MTPDTIQAPDAEQTASHPAQQTKPGITKRLGLERFSGVYAFGLIILLFGLWIPDLFLQVDTLRSVLIGNAITALVALAVLTPLAAGAYDLSVAAVVGVAVILVALLQSRTHLPWVIASLITMFACFGVGIMNGISVVFLRVNSFIATLAMSSILAAVALWISGGNEIVTGISQSFLSVGQNEVFSIALPVIYMVVLAVILYAVLEHTPFGRYLFAVGDNADASRLAGIRTGRYTFLSLVISATIAGLAGIILCMRIGSGSLNAGDPYLLPAFAAAFLGSTQLKPGRFNVWGTILAVYLLATGVEGLQLAGAANWVSPMFNGVALLIAVSVAMLGAKNRRGA